MECIRQNDDCGIEVSSKVTAVAMTIFSSATFGLFGELAKLGQKISWAVKCSNSMMLVYRGIIRYIRTMKAEDPQASDRKLLIALYQTSTVVTDLPIAITICMGKAVPPTGTLRLSQYMLSTAEWVIMQALAHDDSIISSWGKFRAFLTGANFTEAAEQITTGEIESLETAMKQNSSCGGDLKSLTDRVWWTVNEYRQDNPAITDDEIRLKISESDLVLYDVPTVTNNCMHQMISESTLATAYQTREVLRKTFGVIINDLIKSGKSDNGKSYEDKQKAYKVVDFAFSTVAASLVDPTRITLLFAEYIQSICGPTQFMGEIDDGTAAATLGLNTIQDAFRGSTSSWTKKGDGVVIINFTSTDKKDVTVNIKSGGDKVAQVKVKAGGTASWKSTVKQLGGKTLYLDRWPFGSNEASSTTSDSVGKVEAGQAVASSSTKQIDAFANVSTGSNSTSHFTPSLLATSTKPSIGSIVQEDTTQQSTIATTTSSDVVAQIETTTLMPLDTISTTTSLLPNWVGTVDPSDNSCYRKTYISKSCSVGYAYDNVATCWAQCPLNYPVQCGMECIPQSDDCALEIITKIESVATVALNAATSGVFGQLSTASAAVQQGVKCGQKLFTVVENAVDYAEELQTNFPNGTQEQIISLLNNSDIVIKDLPTTVYTFMTFISAIGAGSSVESLDKEDTNTLEKLISKGKTCGTELQSIISKVTQSVADIKSADATSTTSAIREALSTTALFLTEIPTVTNNCMQNITGDAYTVRDQIRKALSVITDNLIDSSDDESGNALSTADYILKIADMGLDVIAMFDPTGIAKMLEEFIQPICDPTSFIGEIDDGSLADALALVADGEAFAESYGTWTRTGDGVVNIVFESTDTENVTVEIHSGGETIDSVDVKGGETVSWSSTVSALQDKTMYLDRWRPGLLGLPGSGGGSLVMWVPHSTEGGHVDLVAKINVS
ncbi:Hypothetical protein PHPALM_3049 [Phytophthora palmivora]|uniref:Uncharacterized protein n=1 Tax=Phytophthora palmivora TaxID=4796 RepID=A0A2P4YNE3_9STRA|nr:Hypothetical protein PHPALM_3049 [Phytophthora palmivora]